MCTACELGFWDMMEALPPETRERILREEAARQNASFACDAPEDAAGDAAPLAATPPTEDERKPIVKSRE